MDKKEDKIYSKLSDGFPSTNYLYLSFFVSRNINIYVYIYINTTLKASSMHSFNLCAVQQYWPELIIYIDSPQLTVVCLMAFQLYDGAQAVSIQ